MRLLFILFVLVPLLEMVLLIKVGGIIGALPTIALVCLTAAIGVALIRAQGASTMLSAQQKMAHGEVPAKELLDGLSLIVGGAMLLTPGFVTDSFGFILLIPALRRMLFHSLLAKVLSGRSVMSSFQNRSSSYNSSDSASTASHREKSVYEGEFSREDKPR